MTISKMNTIKRKKKKKKKKKKRFKSSIKATGSEMLALQ